MVSMDMLIILFVFVIIVNLNYLLNLMCDISLHFVNCMTRAKAEWRRPTCTELLDRKRLTGTFLFCSG